MKTSRQELIALIENKTYKIKERLGNGGYIISWEQKSSIVDKNGNVAPSKQTKHNILKTNGSLACEEWFDFYRKNDAGACIIARKKTALEYERILKYYDFSKGGVPTTTVDGHRYLIGGRSIEDLVPIRYKYSYGLVNKEGDFTINAIYDGLEFANEDCCIATMFNGYELHGYVDTITGKQITPIKFAEAEKFNNGMAKVRTGMQTGFIGRNKIITSPHNSREYAIAPITGTVSDFKDGKARVITPTGHEYCIDQTGNPIPSSYVKKTKI